MKKFQLLVVVLLCSIIQSSAQDEWMESTLSSICLRMGTASLGSNVYFAGGARGINLLPSKVVDIYDVNMRLWSISNLSVAREFPVGVSNGNKVFFAGGIDFINGVSFSDVDIYDMMSQKWTTAYLSQARFGIAAVSYGKEILFAGGIDLKSATVFDLVDIYNTQTGIWSTATLSEARTAMGFAVAGNKAVFAGGYNLNTVTDRVDIFDFNTGVWSTAKLSLARGFVTATAVGNKVIIAGGMTNANVPTDRVDIYDVSTGNWTISKLSAPRAFLDNAGSACGKAYFVGGGNLDLTAQVWTTASDIVDIYDEDTGNWSVEHISRAVVNHGVIANGNHLLVAGGTDLNTSYMTVDINTCTVVSNDNLQIETKNFSVLPNPAINYFTIILPTQFNNLVVSIADINGNIIYKNDASNIYKMEVDAREFIKGLYLIQIQSKDFIQTQKIILTK